MMRGKYRILTACLVFSLTAGAAWAAPLALPTISVGVGKVSQPGDVSAILQIFFLMTVLSLAPGLLIMTTSFTRTVVVLSFLRNAIGAQQAPSNQIIVGLSMFLTFFIMTPVWQQIDSQALKPYKAGTITQEVAFKRAVAPVRKFMFSQTREKDIALFLSLSKTAQTRECRRCTDHDPDPGLHGFGIKNGFPDRFPHLHTFSGCGYGGRFGTHVNGDDDAAAGHDIASLQDTPFYPGGRMGIDDRLAGEEFRMKNRSGRGKG